MAEAQVAASGVSRRLESARDASRSDRLVLLAPARSVGAIPDSAKPVVCTCAVKVRARAIIADAPSVPATRHSRSYLTCEIPARESRSEAAWRSRATKISAKNPGAARQAASSRRASSREVALIR